MPVLEEEEIKKLISSKEIQYISLDTNIFSGCSFNFTMIPLNIIPYISKIVRPVISEIVKNEVLKNYNEYVNKNIKSFNESCKKIKKLNNINIKIPSNKNIDIEKYTKNQFDIFCKNSNCIIYWPKTGIDIKDVFSLYFSSKPPFEDTGEKKKEFPDASILLSIEKFAEENSSKVLFLSNDNGCKQYIKQSKNIITIDGVYNDYKNMLNKILYIIVNSNSNASDIFLIEKFKYFISSNTRIINKIKERINNFIDDTSNFYLNLSSAYYYEAEISEILLNNISLKDSYFYIEKKGERQINFACSCKIDLYIDIYYEKYTKDYIDKDYVLIDANHIHTDYETYIQINFKCNYTFIQDNTEYIFSNVSFDMKKDNIQIELGLD